MKIIKRVRYQRVRLGSLDGGDNCTPDLDRGWRSVAHRALRMGCAPDEIVLALDLDKYPPEVTWDMVNVPEEYMNPTGTYVVIDIPGMMGEYETVYE